MHYCEVSGIGSWPAPPLPQWAGTSSSGLHSKSCLSSKCPLLSHISVASSSSKAFLNFGVLESGAILCSFCLLPISVWGANAMLSLKKRLSEMNFRNSTQIQKYVPEGTYVLFTWDNKWHLGGSFLLYWGGGGGGVVVLCVYVCVLNHWGL